MVEPFEGRMVLIDCDSLIVPEKLPAQIEGTRWYRAPEIVQKKVSTPSVETDRHALAVLLYLWLLEWHPLMGDKHVDDDPERNEQLLLGEKALYIEHPSDLSNRAKGQKLTSKVLGTDMELLFQRAFVKGLHNDRERPFPHDWQVALHHTYDRIIPCSSPSCEWHSFVAIPNQKLTCPKCSSSLNFPRALPFMYLFRHRRDDYDVNNSIHYIVGWPGRYLYQWHSLSHASPIYSGPNKPLDTTPKAVFEFEPTRHQWYIKNLALHDMLYKNDSSSDSWQLCSINASLPLVHGMWIQLGSPPEHYRAKVDII